jgi:hypothetical protein
MDRKAAKELLHIGGWLDRSAEIVERGKDAYLADDLLQEAGDSLMMKLGEAANRMSRLDVLAPDGVEWAPKEVGFSTAWGLCARYAMRSNNGSAPYWSSCPFPPGSESLTALG